MTTDPTPSAREVAERLAEQLCGLDRFSELDAIESALLAREAEVWREAEKMARDRIRLWCSSAPILASLADALASRGDRQRTGELESNKAGNPGCDTGSTQPPSAFAMTDYPVKDTTPSVVGSSTASAVDKYRGLRGLLATLDLYANGADAYCMVSADAARVIRHLVERAAALDALEEWLRLDKRNYVFSVECGDNPKVFLGIERLDADRTWHCEGPTLSAAIQAALSAAKAKEAK